MALHVDAGNGFAHPALALGLAFDPERLRGPGFSEALVATLQRYAREGFPVAARTLPQP